MLKVISLVGVRPQFIKEAVISKVVHKNNAWNHVLVHSGQHYDFNMSSTFFDELGIPKPDYFLGVGSGSHAVQTAEAMCKFEEVLLKEKPELVIVYGDTNTTLAGALDAAKLHIPIAHVEAGPRRYNKLFPEEVNRVLTDHISDLLFACTELNVENLRREGITKGVFNAGDVMYDLYLHMQPRLTPEDEMRKYGLSKDKYSLVTIHRDFNTDDRERFSAILKGLNAIGEGTGLQIVFPMHPRARKKAEEFGLGLLLESLTVTEPLGYLELMSLLKNAKYTITDSGGFQRETYWAEKRALLIVPQGWQEITDTGWHLLENDPCGMDWIKEIEKLEKPMDYPGSIFGDGHAAEKIVTAIKGTFA